MPPKPYVTIDAEILNSSLWSKEAHVKIVWITMLVLCDLDGYVGASIPGLARQAGVSTEEAQDALKVLLSPDPYSRSEKAEGRRIEVAERGWKIINFEDHLDRLGSQRKATRERVRRYRTRRYLRRQIADPPPDECELCEEPFEEPKEHFRVLDHNHDTGAIRGWLCQSCNSIVGRLENGTPVRDPAKRALGEEWLKRYSNVTRGAGSRDEGKKGRGKREEGVPTQTDLPATRAGNYVSKACDIWNHRYGAGTANGARIGAALKPLVKHHGEEKVMEAWMNYVATREARFANPQEFGNKFLEWVPGAAKLSAKERKSMLALKRFIEQGGGDDRPKALR